MSEIAIGHRFNAGCCQQKGVDDGNLKVGALSSRQKKAASILSHFDFEFLPCYRFLLGMGIYKRTGKNYKLSKM